MKKSLSSAIDDFNRARLQAKLEGIVARLTGRSTELLSYEEVRRTLRAREKYSRELEDIPLDAIVGSVGRYRDFTRSFLPKQEGIKDRWARVEVAMTGMEGVPPIEVYQVGNAYFVRDGNHRVSVARRMGSDYIQAYVTEVDTKVPLSPDVEPDDLIIKAEHADFLDHTRLDETRPGAELWVTVPGRYRILEEHIEVHRYFMGREQKRYIPYEEAATHWYDEVYLPAVRLIRQRGILRDFPERTETDLYVWLAEHKADLEEELGWQVSPEMAASDLATRFSEQPGRVFKRIGRKVLKTITPDELEFGPPAGRWREERLARRQDDRLFASILVAIRGDESGWSALEQALAVAHQEGARLQGLHVIPTEEQREHPDAQAIQSDFGRRCYEAGVDGRLVFEVGPVQRKICDRARWADLVVTSLNYPPTSEPMSKISSGIVTLIHRCPRPILVVPEEPSAFQHALLAYDGTPKAREALFIATYISGRWQVPLTALTVIEGDDAMAQAQGEARDYLAEHGVDADYEVVQKEKKASVADHILATAEDRGCDLILMGGYGSGPVVEAVLGSTVDQLLRKSTRPMLICR
jgi:nucleotide-binding universal stress UspA family protein